MYHDNQISIVPQSSNNHNVIETEIIQNNPRRKTFGEHKVVRRRSNMTMLCATVKRPTFYIGSTTNSVRAAGILFFHISINNEKSLLFINNQKKSVLEDLGGKTDALDKNLFDTAIRETIEESNGIFTRKFLIEKLGIERRKYKNTIKPKQLANKLYCYSKHGKYCLFLIKLDDKINCDEFGLTETHTGNDRTLEWISFNDFVDKKFKIHPRLTSNMKNNIKRLLSLEVFNSE